MSVESYQEVTVERIPLHWAVPILVSLVLPLSLYLSEFNFPLWVAFIVWAEYFALGGKPDTWKLILPSLPWGVFCGVLWIAFGTALSGSIGLLWGLIISCFIFVTLLVYGLRWFEAWSHGSLAVFNGFTLFLAVYFTGTIPAFGPMENPYWVIGWAGVWCLLHAWFGWFLGWFNIAITFPYKKKVSVEKAQQTGS